jgi:hypothetical protein
VPPDVPMAVPGVAIGPGPASPTVTAEVGSAFRSRLAYCAWPRPLYSPIEPAELIAVPERSCSSYSTDQAPPFLEYARVWTVPLAPTRNVTLSVVLSSSPLATVVNSRFCWVGVPDAILSRLTWPLAPTWMR